LSILFVLLALGGKVRATYENAFSYARRSESIERWLNAIASHTEESDRILIVFDPRTTQRASHLEPILSEMLNRKNTRYYFAFYAPPTQDRHLQRLGEKFITPEAARNRILNVAEIDALVFLGKELEERFLDDSKDWFDPKEFRGYVLVGWLKENKLSEKWNRKN
jgi:hypothetical protein